MQSYVEWVEQYIRWTHIYKELRNIKKTHTSSSKYIGISLHKKGPYSIGVIKYIDTNPIFGNHYSGLVNVQKWL